MEYEEKYASKAVGNAGLTTGIIGTVLGAMAGGSGLLSGLSNTSPNGNNYVNRYELDMQMGYEKQIQELSLKNAALEADKISDAKDVEVYRTLRQEMNNMNDKLSARINFCEGSINAQAVYNATNTANIGCIQRQVYELQAMTKTVIPNTSICPGWGAVTVAPTPATDPATPTT